MESEMIDGSTVGTEDHDPALDRTGRLFGGLISDVRRKARWYLSDFTDGRHLQCVATALFMYFGCLSTMITFGGFLGVVTGNYIAVFECLVSGAICGVTYYLFCGQPLTIISTTGPVLLFEAIVYGLCEQNNWQYLEFRFWVGIWICVIFLFFVAFELSFLVRYVTRFTKESFAVLIAIIFIYEACKNQLQQQGLRRYVNASDSACQLDLESEVYDVTTQGFSQGIVVDSNNVILERLSTEGFVMENATSVGGGCQQPFLSRKSFFFSCFLFLGTFLICVLVKLFKKIRFFPYKVRVHISCLAVVIAICFMVGTSALSGLETVKLQVPESFRPTRPDRGWVINPFQSTHNPWYVILIAFPLAAAAAVLMFLDQHLPTAIISQKDNKLKKGSGYHLDLFVIAVQIAICSVLGTPWFLGTTILSINHVQSLTMETLSLVPGERPKFIGVREQRVTGILVFIWVGLSTYFAKFLKYIPMSVLYGVFLYMGVTALPGTQFISRILVIFTPAKYRPDYAFLQQILLSRVHLYTFIQVFCVICLCIVKEIETIAIIFPLMVVATCLVRKGLEWVFPYGELTLLDDIMPGSFRCGRGEEYRKDTVKSDDIEMQVQGVDLSQGEATSMIPETTSSVVTSNINPGILNVASSGASSDDVMPPAYDVVVHNRNEFSDHR